MIHVTLFFYYVVCTVYVVVCVWLFYIDSGENFVVVVCVLMCIHFLSSTFATTAVLRCSTFVYHSPFLHLAAPLTTPSTTIYTILQHM